MVQLLRSLVSPTILSLMAQYSASLDEVFAALADPTRRTVVGMLGGGQASVAQVLESARPLPCEACGATGDVIWGVENDGGRTAIVTTYRKFGK